MRLLFPYDTLRWIIFLCISLIRILTPLPIAAADGPELLWETVDINLGDCSPVVGSDGTVYITNSSNNINETEGLYAFNPDGTIKWVFEARINDERTPVIGYDGTIYFTGYYERLYAVNPDGSERWRYEFGTAHSAPAIGYDGSVYIGDKAGFLYAISPQGELQWIHATGQSIEKREEDIYRSINSSPVVGQDGTIYVPSRDNYLYAINPDGLQKWAFQTSYFIKDASPAIGADGTLYIGNLGGRFYAINPDGTEQWNIHEYGVGRASPAVASDGSIYAGASDGTNTLFKLAPDGSIIWEYSTPGGIGSSIVIGHDGTVMFVAVDVLYALNPDGTEKWTYQLNYPLDSCPTLTPDGTMYLAGQSLLALKTDIYGYQPDAPWPGFTFSPQRSIAISGITQPQHYTVRGYITEPDLTPIPDVMVAVNGLMTITDQEGHYSLSIPDGSYTLKIYVESTEIPKRKEFHVDGGDVVIDLYEGSGSLLHDVSGRVIVSDGALDGAIVTTEQVSTSTNANGNFLFRLANGEYTLAIDAGENRFPNLLDLNVDKNDIYLGDIFVNTIDWTYTVNSLFPHFYPETGPDGTIYFIADDRLHALTPDGIYITDIELGSSIYASPATDRYGTVYIASWNAVYAYHADLSPKWSFPVSEFGAGSAPAIGDDGSLYFGSIDRLYSLTPDGEKRWEFYIGDRVNSTPVIGNDGTVYVTNSDHTLYALDTNGTLQWIFPTGGYISVSPVLGDDGTIYFGSYDHYFYALNPDGTMKWKFDAKSAVSTDAIIGMDGTIYIVTQQYYLYALNPDGTLKWEYRHDNHIDHSFWVCPYSGEIWLNDRNETIVLRNDGALSWRAPIPYMMLVSAPDGGMYAFTESIESRSCSLHAISGGGIGKLVTMVEDENYLSSKLPGHIPLDHVAAYPNPFNPATTIEFMLLWKSHVCIDIYSITGQKVVTLVDESLPAGTFTARFDGTGLASGVYFARLETDGAVTTKKIMLVK